jgi:hypothetical protein
MSFERRWRKIRPEVLTHSEGLLGSFLGMESPTNQPKTAERLMTPTVTDRGGVTYVEPPKVVSCACRLLEVEREHFPRRSAYASDGEPATHYPSAISFGG